MGGAAKATIDHDFIKRWAEERNGKPAAVKRTGRSGDPGILRIDFPGYSGGDSLRHISWEEFFDAFEANNLAFLYQETIHGQQSRFNKLVDRDNAMASAGSDKQQPSRKGGAQTKQGESARETAAEEGEQEEEEEEEDEDEDEEEEEEEDEDEAEETEAEETEVEEDEAEESEAEETEESEAEESEAEEAQASDEQPRSGRRPSGQSPTSRRGRIDLNTASAEELAGLEGVSRQRAQHIVDYRQKHGPFKSVDELDQVPGFSSTLVEKVRSQATISTDTGSSRGKQRRSG